MGKRGGQVLRFGMLAASLNTLVSLLFCVRANLSEEQVRSLVEERNEKRKAKRFEQADAIRADLASRGIAIMDTPGGGTEWRPASYVGCD